MDEGGSGFSDILSTIHSLQKALAESIPGDSALDVSCTSRLGTQLLINSLHCAVGVIRKTVQVQMDD